MSPHALIFNRQAVSCWIPGSIFHSLPNLLKSHVSESRAGLIEICGYCLNQICGGVLFFFRQIFLRLEGVQSPTVNIQRERSLRSLISWLLLWKWVSS